MVHLARLTVLLASTALSLSARAKGFFRNINAPEKVRDLKRTFNAPPESATLESYAPLIHTSKYDVRYQQLKGDEVLVPCSECQKIVMKFVEHCERAEATGQIFNSLRSFCFALPSIDPAFTEADHKYCLSLDSVLAAKTGTNPFTSLAPNKFPGVCSTFSSYCSGAGGPPKCYSGFCDANTGCIDCPSVALDVTGKGDYEEQVCGDRGTCLLGWKHMNGGGTGYCECDPPYKGLSCNQQ